MKSKSLKRTKLDIIDIEKLYKQHKAGFTIRQISMIWDLPYASLYRAIKKWEEDEKK